MSRLTEEQNIAMQARNKKIFGMIKRGYPYPYIAQIFNISKGRIWHISKMFPKKALMKSRKEVVRRVAIQRGELLDTLSVFREGFTGRDAVREAVRKRDNYTCQACGKIWVPGQRRFDVHHLDGICGKKSRGYDKVKDDSSKLVCVCHKCHYHLNSFSKKGKVEKLKRSKN